MNGGWTNVWIERISGLVPEAVAPFSPKRKINRINVHNVVDPCDPRMAAAVEK